MKKTSTESYRILVEVYGEYTPAEWTCQRWFARFKSADFGLEDEVHPGRPKKFEDEELLEALLKMKIVAKPKKSTQNLWKFFFLIGVETF